MFHATSKTAVPAVAAIGLLTAASALTTIQTLTDGVAGVDGLGGVRWAELSPNGRHLYAAGQNDSAIAVFARDNAAGTLNQVQLVENGVDGVEGIGGTSNLAISPDGRHLYAGATFEASLATFDRDRATGMLTFKDVLREPADVPGGFDFIVWVRVSPDGKNVYTTAFFSGTVLVFRRDPADGTLTLMQTLQDGVGGIDGIGGAFALDVSPDGRNVYVSGLFDSAVAVFARDTTDGSLTPIQVARDGVDGVDGLFLARAVSTSGDGRHVYAGSVGDNAIAHFDRDATTGEISFVEALFNGVDGVEGIGGAAYIEPSHNGRKLFVAGFGDGAIAAFDRSGGDGRLSFVESAPGFPGAITLSASNNGKHLYGVAFFTDTVAAIDVSH